jgi:hypothetical protein
METIINIIKSSQATSRVNWLKGEKKQRFEDRLCPRLQRDIWRHADWFSRWSWKRWFFRLLTK